MDRLPAKVGRVFMMREWLEWDVGDICTGPGIAAGHCGVLLCRPRLRLRECLDCGTIARVTALAACDREGSFLLTAPQQGQSTSLAAVERFEHHAEDLTAAGADQQFETQAGTLTLQPEADLGHFGRGAHHVVPPFLVTKAQGLAREQRRGVKDGVGGHRRAVR